MNRRHVLIGVAAAALLCLNLWHWWPASGVAVVDQRQSVERSTPDSLRVRIATETEKAPALRRDLFHPRVVVAKAPPPAPAPPPPSGPPPKTPEEIAEEAARAELAQIRLVGIVFRGEAGEAFLVKGDEAYIVRNGQKVGERFAVESVGADAVSLKDPRTRVTGKLSVSGK